MDDKWLIHYSEPFLSNFWETSLHQLYSKWSYFWTSNFVLHHAWLCTKGDTSLDVVVKDTGMSELLFTTSLYFVKMLMQCQCLWSPALGLTELRSKPILTELKLWCFWLPRLLMSWKEETLFTGNYVTNYVTWIKYFCFISGISNYKGNSNKYPHCSYMPCPALDRSINDSYRSRVMQTNSRTTTKGEPSCFADFFIATMEEKKDSFFFCLCPY